MERGDNFWPLQLPSTMTTCAFIIKPSNSDFYLRIRSLSYGFWSYFLPLHLTRVTSSSFEWKVCRYVRTDHFSTVPSELIYSDNHFVIAVCGGLRMSVLHSLCSGIPYTTSKAHISVEMAVGMSSGCFVPVNIVSTANSVVSIIHFL